MDEKQRETINRICVKARRDSELGVDGVLNIGPYVHVEFARELLFDFRGEVRSFLVFSYRAFNVMGLIGTEENGIAIADNDEWQILLDAHGRIGSGWYGLSDAQWAEAERICSLTWGEFRKFVNEHPRSRLEI